MKQRREMQNMDMLRQMESRIITNIILIKITEEQRMNKNIVSDLENNLMQLILKIKAFEKHVNKDIQSHALKL